VLLPRHPDAKLATSIAPGNPLVGLFLPYSPLHRLLVMPGESWVMTSGNLSDEPIARDNEEAIARLSNLCDAFLLHNRPIETVCDDSILRSFRSRSLPIRRSRGYCPLPIPLQSFRLPEPLESEPNEGNSQLCVLAVGGEIKAAVCLAHENQAILGQHIGDMGNRETLVALNRSVEHLLQLYQAKPAAIVADMHPGYLSTDWAKTCAREKRIVFLSVQHHHAHAVALMAEHGLIQEADSIIACVFDGTGYGSDGAIWGGEWLIANRFSYQRFGQLDYTPLPGGDSAIDRPAKIALAQLTRYSLPWDERLPCVSDLSEIERTLLHQQLQKKVNTLNTSSMGRLFDCVASLIGVRQRVHYEGQAAIELEHLASSVIVDNLPSGSNPAVYPFLWNRQKNWVLNYGPMLEAIMHDVISGTQAAEIAVRFHRTIALATSELCQRARCETGINIVGLTGGVFQNVLMAELTSAELDRAGFRVLTHLHVPPNDGGLALGQALIGRSILAANR
jgi:hydrogenase maturation protein HypF